jgi:hypothetical protein
MGLARRRNSKHHPVDRQGLRHQPRTVVRALVASVIPDYPAARAGPKSDDVINRHGMRNSSAYRSRMTGPRGAATADTGGNWARAPRRVFRRLQAATDLGRPPVGLKAAEAGEPPLRLGKARRFSIDLTRRPPSSLRWSSIVKKATQS